MAICHGPQTSSGAQITVNSTIIFGTFSFSVVKQGAHFFISPIADATSREPTQAMMLREEKTSFLFLFVLEPLFGGQHLLTVCTVL